MSCTAYKDVGARLVATEETVLVDNRVAAANNPADRRVEASTGHIGLANRPVWQRRVIDISKRPRIACSMAVRSIAVVS